LQIVFHFQIYGHFAAFIFNSSGMIATQDRVMPDAFQVPSIAAPSSETTNARGWTLLLAASALIASMAAAQAHSPFGKIDDSFAPRAQTSLVRGAAFAPFRPNRSSRLDLRLDAAQLACATEFAESLRAKLAYGASGFRTGALRSGLAIAGAASTYNPNRPTGDSGGLETASGEIYDASAWTAAIQIDLRAVFGGVHYGRNYRAGFALVTDGEKSAVVRINDVGPLLPGRVIDLNERTMRYFDPALQRGLVKVVVTPLEGEHWRAGPLDAQPAIGMAGDLRDDFL
jgi:rare lipoprotein A